MFTSTPTTTSPPRPHRRPRRLALATAAIVVASLATGCNAWGPVTSSYHGHTVVKGDGFANKTAQDVSDSLHVTDTLNDGNSVYGHVDFQFWESSPDGFGGTDWSWTTAHGHSTPGFSNTDRSYGFSSGLQGDSSRTRVKSFVCAQMGWPVPDSCSNSAYITYDY